jgi:hypothetical protein
MWKIVVDIKEELAKYGKQMSHLENMNQIVKLNLKKNAMKKNEKTNEILEEKKNNENDKNKNETTYVSAFENTNQIKFPNYFARNNLDYDTYNDNENDISEIDLDEHVLNDNEFKVLNTLRNFEVNFRVMNNYGFKNIEIVHSISPFNDIEIYNVNGSFNSFETNLSPQSYQEDRLSKLVYFDYGTDKKFSSVLSNSDFFDFNVRLSAVKKTVNDELNQHLTLFLKVKN